MHVLLSNTTYSSSTALFFTIKNTMTNTMFCHYKNNKLQLLHCRAKEKKGKKSNPRPAKKALMQTKEVVQTAAETG